MNLRQEEGESLHTFIDSFGVIAIQIKDLTPNLILLYMIMALRSSPFADELVMRPPLGMQELQKRASMFIRVEEMRHYQDRVQAPLT